MPKLTWPAPERNQQPISEVLTRVLEESGTLLEIASGTGQHAVYFARRMTRWIIQPSDVAAENLDSIRAWVRESALPNLREPVRIDVLAPDWIALSPSAIFNANMIHIAPWEAAIGLVSGSARLLGSGGKLVIYGPFRVGGRHTAPSNEDFDRSLRERDPRFGVRDLEALVELAERFGFNLQERVTMPANNSTLVFAKL